MTSFDFWISRVAISGVGLLILTACEKPVATETSTPPPQEEVASATPVDADTPAIEETKLQAREMLANAIDAQLGRKYDESMTLFQQALDLDSELVGVRYQMAVVAMNQGDEEAAEQFAYESIGREEQAAQAYNLIATMAARRQDFPVAEWAFFRAQEASPSDAMAFYNASEALRHQGKFQPAVDQLRAAIQRNPGEPLFALKLRLARIELGEGDQMIPEVQQELSATPPAGDWMLTAAAISLSNERYDEAAEMLERARLTMQPILFFGILQEDPFFHKFRLHPAIAPFTDVEIQVNPSSKKDEEAEANSAN